MIGARVRIFFTARFDSCFLESLHFPFIEQSKVSGLRVDDLESVSHKSGGQLLHQLVGQICPEVL